MKVLVTGATGYVGNSLALTLAKQGILVHILIRDPKSVFIPQHPGIKIFTGDILKKETIAAAAEGCEIVFHTAGLVKFYANNPEDFFKINVEGTHNMLDAALKTGVKKFVFTSTCGVIGPSLNKPMSENDPRITGFENDYNLSKSLAEKLVIEYSRAGLFTVIASAAKVFGPGVETHQFSVNGIIRRFIKGKICFCPRPPDLISNYVFINDLVRGHILAAEKGRNGEKYILGGENLCYADFFQKLQNISGIKGVIVPMPKSIARLYGNWHFLQARLLNKEPFFNSGVVSEIYCNKSFTSAKAIEELGYSITPIPAALQLTIHSLKIEMYAKQSLYPDYRVQ